MGALILLPSILAGAGAAFLVSFTAQAAAAGLECFFVFFAIVALQGVLLNTLPGRWFVRVSVWVQGGLIAVLLFAGLRTWWVQKWGPDMLARLPEFGRWAPPVWFAGLHETLLGARDPFFDEMARRAVLASVSAVALAAVTYLVSYRRYRRLILEAPIAAPRSQARAWSVAGLLARESAVRTA